MIKKTNTISATILDAEIWLMLQAEDWRAEGKENILIAKSREYSSSNKASHPGKAAGPKNRKQNLYSQKKSELY